MTRAIPEHWIERLFARMESIWGAKFEDFWRNVSDPDQVKAVWREGLAGVTDEGLKRGVAALFHEKSPPTLPRFLELCQPQPAMYRPQPALTDETGRTAPDEARAQLASIADAVSSAMKTTAGDPLAWARRIIARHERGESVTSRQLQHARDAVAEWEVTHGTAHALGNVELPARIPSPHIEGDTPSREPGCDDDLEVA